MNPQEVYSKTERLLAEFALKHNGDAASQDAVVVIATTGGEPAGKIFTLKDGKPAKSAAPQMSSYFAWQVGVPNPAAMADLLRLVGRKEHMGFALGRFDAVPEGDHPSLSKRFAILSSSKATKEDHPVKGWFDVNDDCKGICRSKENMIPSSWLLLDRDFTDDMPERMTIEDVGEWWEAMCQIAPQLTGVGRVDLSSSSTRLLGADGNPVMKSPSTHHYVQMEDCDQISVLGPTLLARALVSGWGFNRNWGGRASRAWAIFDPTTFSHERLSFEGKPANTIKNTTIADPVITVIEGGKFDAGQVEMPARDQMVVIAEQYGLTVKVRKSALTGVSVATIRDKVTLRLDTPVEVLMDRKETTKTVEDLWLWSVLNTPASGKLRAQTLARESTSWAALVALTQGGQSAPFVYDVGPHVTLVLRDEDAIGPCEKKFFTIVHSVVDDRDLDDEEKLTKLSLALTGWGASLGRHDKAELAYMPRINALAKDVGHLLGGTPAQNRKMLLGIIERGFDTGSIAMMRNRSDGRVADEDETEELEWLKDWVDSANDRMSQVIHGGKSLIAKSEYNPELKLEQVNFYEPKAMQDRLAPERIRHVTEKGVEIDAPFPLWFKHPQRNTIEHVYFRPELSYTDDIPKMPINEPLNLWRGYQYRPIDPVVDKVAGDASKLMIEHIADVWCDSNDEKLAWLMDWFGVLVQQPDKIGMPVPVLKSEQGAGKGSIIDNVFVPLFGAHAMVIEKPELITGRFNGHLGINCFVSANEAVWGGRKEQTGAYKALVTDETRVVEAKFKDPVISKNFTSLLMSTNNEWFAPMDVQDRRHAVFDVSDKRLGDMAYFSRLHKAVIPDRGRQAFLHTLLAREVDIDRMRKSPSWQSKAADHNLLAGLEPHYAFLAHWLAEQVVAVPDYAGAPGYAKREKMETTGVEWDFDHRNGELKISENEPNVYLKTDIFEAFQHFARRKPYTTSPNGFWMHMNKIFGHHMGVHKRERDGVRTRVIILPKVTEARELFAKHLGRDFMWSTPIDGDAPGDPGAAMAQQRSFDPDAMNEEFWK